MRRHGTDSDRPAYAMPPSVAGSSGGTKSPLDEARSSPPIHRTSRLDQARSLAVRLPETVGRGAGRRTRNRFDVDRQGRARGSAAWRPANETPVGEDASRRNGAQGCVGDHASTTWPRTAFAPWRSPRERGRVRHRGPTANDETNLVFEGLCASSPTRPKPARRTAVARLAAAGVSGGDLDRR